MYFKLFLTFAYIGVVSFGGGYAMLPMFRRVLAEKNGWVTNEEIVDIFSVCQCLPGVIACNTAIFVGYRQKGILGGVFSAFGAAFPSVVILLILAAFISHFSEIRAVQSAFAGIRVGVSVLIVNTVIKLWKQAITDKFAIGIFTAVFFVSVFTSVPVAILVVAAGFCGIGISALRKEPK